MTITRAALELAAHAGDFLIPDCMVAPRRRSAARWGAVKAAALLGLRWAPRIRFFIKTKASGNVEGAAGYGDETILIANGLELADCAGHAAHETHHALVDDDLDETGAHAIGREVRGLWLAERNRDRDRIRADAKTMFLDTVNARTDHWLGWPSEARLEEIFGSVAVGLEEMRLAAKELESFDRSPAASHVPAGSMSHAIIRRRSKLAPVRAITFPEVLS